MSATAKIDLIPYGQNGACIKPSHPILEKDAQAYSRLYHGLFAACTQGLVNQAQQVLRKGFRDFKATSRGIYADCRGEFLNDLTLSEVAERYQHWEILALFRHALKNPRDPSKFELTTAIFYYPFLFRDTEECVFYQKTPYFVPDRKEKFEWSSFEDLASALTHRGPFAATGHFSSDAMVEEPKLVSGGNIQRDFIVWKPGSSPKKEGPLSLVTVIGFKQKGAFKMLFYYFEGKTYLMHYDTFSKAVQTIHPPLPYDLSVYVRKMVKSSKWDEMTCRHWGSTIFEKCGKEGLNRVLDVLRELVGFEHAHGVYEYWKEWL